MIVALEAGYWPGKRGVYGRTLTYGCGPKCETAYSINAHTGKPSDFWFQLRWNEHNTFVLESFRGRVDAIIYLGSHTVAYEGLC